MDQLKNFFAIEAKVQVPKLIKRCVMRSRFVCCLDVDRFVHFLQVLVVEVHLWIVSSSDEVVRHLLNLDMGAAVKAHLDQFKVLVHFLHRKQVIIDL